MLVRLSDIGFIEGEPGAIENIAEIPSMLKRRARLVYCGNFLSMDGPVEVTEEGLRKVAEAHNGRMAKLKRLATGTLPISHMPPVQLDHTRSSRDTIGRIENEDLVIEDWTDEEGQTRKALYGNVRFLGKENVEKILDGRWANLSIAADFEKGAIDELTVTPFPAAGDARLLSRGTLRLQKQLVVESEEGGRYKLEVFIDPATGKFTSYLDGASCGEFLSEDAALQAAQEKAQDKMKEARLAAPSDKNKDAHKMRLKHIERRLRSHFRLRKKMSDEQTEAELKKLEADESEEELKKLAEEMDEEDKKEEEEKSKKLSAAKENITRLSTDFRAKKETVSLAAKSAHIGIRLSALRSTGRITPAEIKKIDIKKLAAQSDEALAAVLKSYEDRQPVILVGQVGSMKPMSLKEIEKAGKQVHMSRLERETRQNMSLLKDTVKLGEGEVPSDNVLSTTPEDSDPKTDMTSMESDYNEVCKMMDEGRTIEAKERLKGWMDRMKKMGGYGMAEPTMYEDSSAQLTALQQDITELSAKFDEAMGLAESLASGG